MEAPELDAQVIDSPNVKRAAEFYARLLGWQIDFISEAKYARISSPQGGLGFYFSIMKFLFP